MDSRQLLRSVYYSGLAGLRFHTRRVNGLRRQNKVAVLNFHRISPDESPYWPPMRPEIFETALSFLVKNFDVCLFDELADRNGDRPAAVISFDDGYYDFIAYALPLLRRFGVRANMNVIPHCVETGRPIWNVRLYDFLAAAPQTLIDELQVPGFQQELRGNSRTEKLAFGLALSQVLKSMSRSRRLEVWEGIEHLMGKLEFAETRMMTVEDIQKIANETEIGAHSYSHESMALEEQEFFEDDFDRCRTFFNEKLKLPLTTYAFPNGSYRPEHIEHLEAQGVRNILLVDERFAYRCGPVYPRLTMYGDTKSQVEMKMCGF